MSDTALWIAKMFGGDNERFQKFVRKTMTPEVKIDLDDPKGAMLCSATALQISRVINVYTPDSAKEKKPLTFMGGLDSQKRKNINISFLW